MKDYRKKAENLLTSAGFYGAEVIGYQVDYYNVSKVFALIGGEYPVTVERRVYFQGGEKYIAMEVKL